MSNLRNYSPYNKTYRYMLLQNQAYHQRNLRNISPCVKTNLRHSLNLHKNPQKIEFNLSKLSPESSPRNTTFWEGKNNKSALFDKKEIDNASIHKPKRIVHKHWSYEKFRNAKINKQNMEMFERIVNTNCHIIKNERAATSYQKHRGYSDIRSKYTPTGQRKDMLALMNADKLCPTLKQYHESGLATGFVNGHLSMSLKPSTSQSMRRSYINSTPERE